MAEDCIESSLSTAVVDRLKHSLSLTTITSSHRGYLCECFKETSVCEGCRCVCM